MTRQQVRVDQLQADLAFKNTQIEKLLQDQHHPLEPRQQSRGSNDQNLEIQAKMIEELLIKNNQLAQLSA